MRLFRRPTGLEGRGLEGRGFEDREFADRARLERMLRDEFALHGIRGEIVRDPDDPMNTSLQSGERIWGFANVLIRALPAPRRRWRGIVRDHVAKILAPTPLTDLSTAEGRQLLRARIVPSHGLPPVPLDYAIPFAPGLIEILCLDHPDRVETVSDVALDGSDAAELRAIGRRNLAREEVPAPERIDDELGIVEGPSLFTASQLLRPGFVRALRGEDAAGLAVAIPDRHAILFHAVRGPDSVHAVGRLAHIAATIDRDTRPGGLVSEHVFFVSDAGVERVTELGPDGGTRVVASGAFLSALE